MIGTLPWGRIVAALVVATALAAGVWKIYHSGKVQGIAETTAIYTERDAKAAFKAQERATRLQQHADQLQEVQNAQTENDRRRIADLSASLRNRANRPANGDTSSVSATQCTGARLYRDDAEFLGWYASEAARVAAALARCEGQYNDAVN